VLKLQIKLLGPWVIKSQTFPEGKGVETWRSTTSGVSTPMARRRPSQKVKVLKPLVFVAVLCQFVLSQTFPEGKGVETG